MAKSKIRKKKILTEYSLNCGCGEKAPVLNWRKAIWHTAWAVVR